MCCRMDGCNARLTALSATFFYFYTQKCDEQRVGDSCQTCIRLRIDCLGWGPKRPAWMRVSTYIAKSSLTFLSPYGAFHFCVARGRAQPCLILPRPAQHFAPATRCGRSLVRDLIAETLYRHG